MVRTLLVFMGIFGASSATLAQNLECVSNDKEVKLDLTEEALISDHADTADLEVGRAFVYSLSYKDVYVRYGQISTEAKSYAKTFDHEAAKFQIDGHTVLFLAETDAQLLKFENVMPTPEEQELGVVSKINLKSGSIYFGRNIHRPEKIQSIDVPASLLSCTSIFSD